MVIKFFTKKPYFRKMKTSVFVFGISIAMLSIGPFVYGQSDVNSEAVQPDFLNVHVTQNSTQSELAQLQKDMSAVNIGFRYDMVNWIDGKLQSIRFALILRDGTMIRNAYEVMDSETDVWIRLEGTGEERVFCAGDKCAD
ncbi:MAG: hypothetical protein CL845_08385 [Crocinitomicaceae bacterium]|nr:hypothetical protein [Crocinitomicaceae bacterium]|tara:strand:+ start:255 stop:674 length:420 start_codon:yes stop_codon:yes gene_type:complete